MGRDGEKIIYLTFDSGYEAGYMDKILTTLKENNVKYNKIFSERPSLNDVFLFLTGKELRD